MVLSKINSINDIVHSYDFFIIDIWGVLHDGNTRAFPHAIEALKSLQDLKKTSVILSNSPRNQIDVALTLKEKGVDSNLYNYLHTSGQEVEDLLFEKEHEFFKKIGSKVFVLGFSNLHEKSGHEVVKDIDEADYILATRVPNDDLNYSKPVLDRAVEKDIPLVCANPDTVAQAFSGPCPCPGIIYDYYRSQNGRAIAIGKPNYEIYTRLFELLNDRYKGFDKAKTIVIGDGMFTDILGAKKEGLDSLLVSSGIHDHLFDWTNLNDEIEEQDFFQISKQNKVLPTYIIKNFC